MSFVLRGEPSRRIFSEGGEPKSRHRKRLVNAVADVLTDNLPLWMAQLALIVRLAALVPPSKRHLTGYFGVLFSHSRLRSLCVPAPVPETTSQQEDNSSRTLPLSHYILWSELLRRLACTKHRQGERQSSGWERAPTLSSDTSFLSVEN